MEVIDFSIARCTWNGSTYAFYVPKSASYEFICREVQSSFTGLNFKDIKMKYSFSNGTKCNLDSDRDVQMMLMSQSVAKADFIEIDIVDAAKNVSVIEQEKSFDVLLSGDPITDFNPILGGDEAVEQIVSMTDHWSQYIKHVKQVFYGGRKQFRQQLIKFSIGVGFKLKFVKNDKTRVTAICAKKKTGGCPWRIHASVKKVNGNFCIRTFNNVHTCGGNVTSNRSS